MEEIDNEFATITFLGRTGLLYKEKGKKNIYYIDSERLGPPEYGIVLYKKSIKKVDEQNSKSELAYIYQREVLEKVITILKSKGTCVEVI